MTEAERDNSKSADACEPSGLPKWLPSSVEKEVRRIAGQGLLVEHRVILLRLATDDRMRTVWNELTKQKRPHGSFMHPAKGGNEAHSRNQDEVQNEALGELFDFVFATACDRIFVSKAEEVEQERKKLLQRAEMLRDLAGNVPTYVSTREKPFADAGSLQSVAADAEALLRVARYQEHLAAAVRKPADPLIVQNNRLDPVVRGVQIAIAGQMLVLFGKVLHGITATIASVALDQETTEKVTRTAFSGRKSSKKGRVPNARKRF